MTNSQRSTRRTSARLLEKEDAHPPGIPEGYYAHSNGKTAPPSNRATRNGMTGGSKQSQTKAPPQKKRKVDYDEEVEGFAFSRTRSKKPRTSTARATTVPESVPEAEPRTSQSDQQDSNQKAQLPKKGRKNKMSFSTPMATEKEPEKPKRRTSRRISGEAADEEKAPLTRLRESSGNAPVSKKQVPSRAKQLEKVIDPATSGKTSPGKSDTQRPDAVPEPEATRIALPFADTPVIRRNKAMRQAQDGKTERRSSLGMRGRRASSLIGSGSSNALPHQEVEIEEFYKHIESEGLPEPRRMKQLLTWCATRALGEKPSSTQNEDETAHMAARVIQEEILKEFSNRSEMSDWFGREDLARPIVVVNKPNPKNIQNAEKIRELEEQIKRLQGEKASLESLLRPPSIPQISASLTQSVHSHPSQKLHVIDRSFLSASDVTLLELLSEGTKATPAAIEGRLSHMATSLGPAIDSFADGIHKISQYRDSADRVADRVLALCSEKLEQRDHDGRRKALGLKEHETEKADVDLGGVLRSLSRLER